ncbi:MAG: cbb3-type cytochrome oxidase assembly protein CcoS [Kiritimatiellia bacterium]
MSAILILLAASLTLALCFLAAFLWSVHQGQFDDPVTPALRMLHDDEPSGGAEAPSEPPQKEFRL